MPETEIEKTPAEDEPIKRQGGEVDDDETFEPEVEDETDEETEE